LAESLPNIKGLQEIRFSANASFLSIDPAVIAGGLSKQHELVESTLILMSVRIGGNGHRELKFLAPWNESLTLLALLMGLRCLSAARYLVSER
jgi:hypothetical protein